MGLLVTLLEKGANPNKSKGYYALLIKAIQRKKITEAYKLLEAGAIFNKDSLEKQ